MCAGPQHGMCGQSDAPPVKPKPHRWTYYKQLPLAFVSGSAGPKLDTRVRVIIVLVLAVGLSALTYRKPIDRQARE